MNKKEIEAIGWVIGEIRAGNMELLAVAIELARICPKANEFADSVMSFTLFDTFYSEMIDYMVTKMFGRDWSIMRDTSKIEPYRHRLYSKEYREQARDVFADYAERAEMTRPLYDDKEYWAIFSTSEWRQAKEFITEEYEYDLSWMP